MLASSDSLLPPNATASSWIAVAVRSLISIVIFLLHIVFAFKKFSPPPDKTGEQMRVLQASHKPDGGDYHAAGMCAFAPFKLTPLCVIDWPLIGHLSVNRPNAAQSGRCAL